MAHFRDKYKRRQDQLLKALFENGREPEGIDSEPLQILRKTLLHKRSASLSRRWPQLRKELADEWDSKFLEHAKSSAKQFQDDALTDGLHFARHLTRNGAKLGRDATEELVAAELRYESHWVIRETSQGAKIIGVRIPILGPRVFVLNQQTT